MNKIALIMPYFGKSPVWFDLYLYSCSKNPFIDFIFFTDCLEPKTIYTNTIFHNISYKDYCEKISHTLNISFTPQSPYKLCDVRPFYGIIHKKELEGYAWWGYGDLDLVYGDLSLIINNTRKHRYKIITTHADRVAGHFTIVKNESKCCTYAYKIKKWREKIENEKIYGLDEHDLTLIVYPFQKVIWRLHRCINKLIKVHPYTFFNFFNVITNKIAQLHIKEYYTSPLPLIGEKWIYDIKKNKIIAPNKKEIPYLHFLFFKKTPFWNNNIYWMEDCWNININKINEYNYIVFDKKSINYCNDIK